MTYTGLELFMDNLKQLSYSRHNPIINNNPTILRKRSQIQQLYEELSFMIQIMFFENQNGVHEVEQIKNLKTRFLDVAQEAHSIVGLFVFSINYKNTCPTSICGSVKYFMNCKKVMRSITYKRTLNLKNVMTDMKSIKKQFIMILDKMKLDSSSSNEPLRIRTTMTAGTSCTINPLGTKTVMKEMVVGLDHDVVLIRDKLMEDHKHLDVVSIVGMGGVGKTTLATKVFNDPFVVYHFDVRAWATVSQSYEKHDLLIQILASIGIEFDPISASHSELRGRLHKSLLGKRYLIVIDDIWSKEAWNDLKMFFPNDHNKSRILLTSRLKEVASHAKLDGLVHQLECLTDEESWVLLCRKVFHDNACPESLTKPGMQIAKNCHGLPLAVVVIAGVLSKEAPTEDSWERVGESVSSYIVSTENGNENGHVDILGLSYEHLPTHLKDCFLYLGGFPEDHTFQIRKLIWLWIAEGFVQKDGNRSLEEIGEDYIMELVDRNLVIVKDRKCIGAVKSCSVHDLLRELCLEKATRGNFCLKISKRTSSFRSIRRHKPRRVFTTSMDFVVNNFFDQPRPWVHSLLCLRNEYSLINNTKGYVHYYPLLTVLDLQKCRHEVFPKDIRLLIHSRYLAFWSDTGFPSLICNLWSLRTIIIRTSEARLYLPKTISNLVNLRHLWSDAYIYFRSYEKPMNLQTISNVVLGDEAESWEKCFPTIKKLTCTTLVPKNQDFELLSSLERLMWTYTPSGGLQFGEFQKIHVTFPTSLKKLSLKGCHLLWSDMSIIQSLPNLEILNILKDGFVGLRWETHDAQFQQLKFLKLEDLDIKQWETSNINFPCLKQIVVDGCLDLEEIPLELGDISTLELIDIDDSSSSVVDSAYKIQEEQETYGNYDLKINVRKVLPHFDFQESQFGMDS